MAEMLNAYDWREIVAVLAVLGLVFGVGQWVGGVNADRASFKAFMEKIDGKIDRILERMSFPPQSTKSESPVRLTEFGKKLSATAKATDWAAANAPELVSGAMGKEEFEVFDICVDRVQTSFESDADFKRSVRAAAYAHGTDSEQVLKVYQVELRDRVLSLLS